MKRVLAIRVAVVTLSSLCGSAFAQMDAQQALASCQSFCTLSKTQCERDHLGAGVSALVAADVLDQLTRSSRTNTPGQMTQLPSLSKTDGNTPGFRTAQRCETERLQCVKDCTVPESKPETPQ